ncbi:sigma 54-interacting transcriptional regulator [Candidatus Margulisiibacteriota bacterium]
MRKIITLFGMRGAGNPEVQGAGAIDTSECLRVDDKRAIYGHPHTIAWLKKETAPILGKNISVLILGETGTGKTLLARCIYNQYIQATGLNGSFVAVNCGAIPEQLIESELFGHAKGAFTGADVAKKGLIQKAEDGVLFLDEIGELPPDMQVKLLRVLDENVIRYVGSTVEIGVNFRLVCATNADLKALVSEGKFREDLYNRIAVYMVKLPALRERSYDIPCLVNYLLGKHAEEQSLNGIPVKTEVLRFLSKKPWSGNIRELDNFLLRLLLLSDGEPVITMDEVRKVLNYASFQPAEDAGQMCDDAVALIISNNISGVLEKFIQYRLTLTHTRKNAIVLLEADTVRAAISKYGSNDKAAEMLGIPVSAIESILEKEQEVLAWNHGLEVGIKPEFHDSFLNYACTLGLKKAIEIFDKELIRRAVNEQSINAASALGIVPSDLHDLIIKYRLLVNPSSDTTNTRQDVIAEKLASREKADIQIAMEYFINHGLDSGDMLAAERLLKEEFAYAAIIMFARQDCSADRSILEQVAELIGIDKDTITACYIKAKDRRAKRGVRLPSDSGMKELINCGWENALKRLRKSLAIRTIHKNRKATGVTTEKEDKIE